MKMSFVCELNKYMSSGWRPEHQPDFDAYGGMATAHDVMEHFPKDSGDISDEFQALGAGLFVRGEAGYYAMKGRSITDPGEQCAPDILTEVTERLFDGKTRWRPWVGETPWVPSHVDEWVERALLSVRRSLSDDWRTMPAADLERARACAKDARAWLRNGYRRAEKRYAPVGHIEACQMFVDIERAADAALKRATDGDRLIVSMCIKRRSVSVRHESEGEIQWPVR